MTRLRMRSSVGLMLCVIATMGGCGGPYDASVEGLVTLDGAPLPSGSISFVPSSGGPSAYARTDSSGRYEVYTGREAGISPGEYEVTVVAREAPTVKQSKLGGPPPPGKQITPPWYASSGHTPLSFSVIPGSNDINLELTTEAPPNWNPQKKRRR